MALCFPKSARLRHASEFLQMRREGRSLHGKFMVLSVLRRDASTEATRIGVVTSRRVGGAVARNRVRRRFRELVRQDRPRLAQSHWLVLIARAQAVTATFAALRAEWEKLARSSGVLLSPA